MDERNEFSYDKGLLRRELLSRRAAVPDRHGKSLAIADKLLPLVGGGVMVYIAIGSEVETAEIISGLLARKDTKVYAPYTTSDGIIVPKRLVRLGKADRRGNLDADCYADNGGDIAIDYCITPLLGFDGNGYRIGYGKGCYDRFFAKNTTYKIGISFDAQRCQFKRDICDIPLDCCVTESKVLYFKTCE